MALNRYNHHPFFGNGFDELFFPTPFLTRDPVLDLMPVLRDFERDENMSLLRSSPGYEISENDGKYEIRVDIPGVKASEMSVQLENEGKVLHISGGRKIEKEGQVTETRFDKRFTIGSNVDVEQMSGNLADGVLTLTAPKVPKQEKPVHKIAITEGPVEKKEL
jgi:HSP20 family protein